MSLQPHKAQKSDLNEEYPCPCRFRGNLTPIVLTDAFGCNCCQQIFVVNENGDTIEQLSTSYTYKSAWRWTGKQWSRAYFKGKAHYLPLALVIVLVPLAVWLLLALHFLGYNATV